MERPLLGELDHLGADALVTAAFLHGDGQDFRKIGSSSFLLSDYQHKDTGGSGHVSADFLSHKGKDAFGKKEFCQDGLVISIYGESLERKRAEKGEIVGEGLSNPYQLVGTLHCLHTNAMPHD